MLNKIPAAFDGEVVHAGDHVLHPLAMVPEFGVDRIRSAVDEDVAAVRQLVVDAPIAVLCHGAGGG